MSEQVYLNGEFLPYGEAKVSVEDRGFQFADGIYEVIQVVKGKLFAMDPHLDRLWEGAGVMRIPVPMPREEFWRTARRLIEVNEVSEGLIYIQLTRGSARRIHAFPQESTPTLVMISRNLSPFSAQVRDEGGSVITVPDNRWGLCYVKTVGLVPNVLAKQKAQEAGAVEALFVRDGLVTEGSSSNAFVIRDEAVYTHPLANILPGVTRRLVIDVAREEGLSVQEKAFSLDWLMEADEMFMTGTIMGVLPIVSVDGRPLGQGKPGPVTARINEAYGRLMEKSLK